jgi:hypothetical protein
MQNTEFLRVVYISPNVSGGDTSIASLPYVQSSLKDYEYMQYDVIITYYKGKSHGVTVLLPSRFPRPVVYIFNKFHREVLHFLVIYHEDGGSTFLRIVW